MKKPVSQFPNPGYLCEITQQNKTEFALCRFDEKKNAVIQCHQFVHCRDFFHDAFVAVESNREMGIYGFKFGKDNPRPDAECTSLLVRFQDDGCLKNFQDNFDLLKGIEEVLGFQVTYPELVDFPDKTKQVVVWLMGDAKWQANAVAFSLYTYLIKCFTTKFKDKSKWMEEMTHQNTNEGKYMNIPWVKWLLNGGLLSLSALYKNYSGWTNQEKVNTGTIHNYSGFITTGQHIWEGKLKKQCEYGEGVHVLDGYKLDKEAA